MSTHTHFTDICTAIIDSQLESMDVDVEGLHLTTSLPCRMVHLSVSAIKGLHGCSVHSKRFYL